MLQTLLHGLSRLVYPPHCLICKKSLNTFSPTEILCPLCQDTIHYNIPPFCPKCSRHLINPQRPKCVTCAKSNPPFDFAWAACPYQNPLSDLICQFKYSQKTYLRKFLAQLMIRFIGMYRFDIHQFDEIIPIPLFPSRLRERGYNQSELLAQEISKKYQIPLRLNALIRVRATEHQTLLREKERWTNIRGAFRIKRLAKLSGKNILVIDDLLTTGATASEAARVIKNAGAETVGILTLAITQ